MTKLIQQLQFSSSNCEVFASIIEPESPKRKAFGDGASSLNSSGSKRTALSASDAECFSLCLGAGPLCSAPPGGVAGGAASPATPSTPTHDDQTRDLLSALLWGSASSLSSSADSLVSEPTINLQQNVIAKIIEKKEKQPVKVDFKIFLTENTVTRWEAVVAGSTLYLRVPSILSSGSKESFMLLLDFAEERLNTTNCVICILKNRSDRATLLRTFMFLGFQLLPPSSPLAPTNNNDDYIFLHYNMQ